MSTVTSIPKHFKPSLSKYSSSFDKETLVDDDKELWLIRVPDNISEKDIEQLKLKAPTSTSTKLAKFEKNNNKYALYRVPTEQFNSVDEDDEDSEKRDHGISGQEMLGFDCLVPCREENGKLVKINKPFEQYLILDEIVDIPDSTALAEAIRDSPVYKREQPEGLKMRFMPAGYYSNHEGPVEQQNNKRVAEAEEEGSEKKKSKKEKKKKEKKEKK
ncbi:hypothetical protein G6F43_005764 [Rhizopus delemar]|nr:hypothetical protein G6F43_005764 [Rhizopus delemar]